MTTPCKYLKFIDSKTGYCPLLRDYWQGELIDNPEQIFIVQIKNGDCAAHPTGDCGMNPDEEKEERWKDDLAQEEIEAGPKEY